MIPRNTFLFCTKDLEVVSFSANKRLWNNISGKCTGLADENSWRNFSETAGWRTTCWTPAAWKAWEHRSLCPLFEIEGVSACNVALDLMHCKYLGSDMYAMGGIWYYMCFYLLPQSPAQNLARLWSELQLLYKELNVEHRYQYFNRLQMFCRRSGPPKLRGRAAEVRGMILPLMHLWQRYHNPALLLHRQILVMLKKNVEFESILADYKGSTFFPADAAQRFKQAAFAMAHLNSLVASHFHQEEDCRWLCHTTAKLHMVLHIASLAETISPRLLWCFSGEDFMKTARALAKNSVTGTKPSMACNKMLEHWRIGMHLHLEALK